MRILVLEFHISQISFELERIDYGIIWYNNVKTGYEYASVFKVRHQNTVQPRVTIHTIHVPL